MGLDTVQTNRLDYTERHEDPTWDFHDIFCMIPMGRYPPVGILFVPPRMHFPSEPSMAFERAYGSISTWTCLLLSGQHNRDTRFLGFCS